MKYHFQLDSAHSEIIFAPFHDPEHSSNLPVEIASDENSSVIRNSLWDRTTFSWQTRIPVAAFCLKILCPFETMHFDQILISFSLPSEATLEITMIHESGDTSGRWSKAVKGKGTKQELVAPVASFFSRLNLLTRKTNFSGVLLRVRSSWVEVPILTLYWIGLRNQKLHRMIEKQRQSYKQDYSLWVFPQESWKEIRFQRSLLFDVKDLDRVRQKLSEASWMNHFNLLQDRAERFMERAPENDLSEHLPNNDRRYVRESRQGLTPYHWEALVLGFVGMVNQDRKMMMHAIKYLLCMTLTPNWTDSSEQNIPSSSWNQRCFMEEMTATSVSILFDWFGSYLNHQAHGLIKKALAEKGIPPVSCDLASFDYVHHMNQGAVFNRAIILAGLMLESGWNNYGSHTVDHAYSSMVSIVNRYVQPDGGVHEGIGYLCQTGTSVLWATIAYARSRKLDWRKEASSLFEKTARYVEAMSAMSPGQALPHGDCRTTWYCGDFVPIMAALFPDSAFCRILDICLTEGKAYELTGTLSGSGGLIGMIYGPDKIESSQSIVPEEDILPFSGKYTRRLGRLRGETIRLWVSGCPSNITHSHRDLGQFGLEIGDQSVFIDPGMVDYWLIKAHTLSRSSSHNVLTPVNGEGHFADQEFPSIFECLGLSDGKDVLTVPGCNVWGERLQNYTRQFVMIPPSSFIIHDSFCATHAETLAFHLHSSQAVEVFDKVARVKSDKYLVEISFLWAESGACLSSIDDLHGRKITRLTALSGLVTGLTVLTTSVSIY